MKDIKESKTVLAAETVSIEEFQKLIDTRKVKRILPKYTNYTYWEDVDNPEIKYCVYYKRTIERIEKGIGFPFE